MVRTDATLARRRPSGAVVVGLGDSISYGMGDLGPGWIGPSWVARFAHQIAAARTVNLSNPGQRVAGLHRAQVPAACAVSPTHALLSIGGNDLLRPTFDPCRVLSEVDEACRSLRDRGCRTVVLGIPAPPSHARIPAWVRDVLVERIRVTNLALAEAVLPCARDGSAGYLDTWRDPATLDREYWHVDCMHPSPRGHEHLAARVREWFGLPQLRHSLATAGGNAAQHTVPRGEWLLREGIPWVARRSIDVLPQMAAALVSHRLAPRVARDRLERTLRAAQAVPPPGPSRVPLSHNGHAA